MATAIKVENLSKTYRLGEIGTGTISRDIERFVKTKILKQEDPFLKIGETNDRATKGASDIIYSLKDINFEIEQGDALGIIGRNGAGKSTLLKILSRVTSPTTGKINIKGRVASLLEVGTGFHPELTGRENIYLNGAILGMRKREIDSKLDEIIDFSGVERYIDTPVKRYSSGMYVRLAFAVAAHLESEILIVDEVLAVGDAEFQKKCLGKMGQVSKGEGRTVLFVSHNMQSLMKICSNSIILDKGTLKSIGSSSHMIENYLSASSMICVSKSFAEDAFPTNEFLQIIKVTASYENDSIPEYGNFSISEKIKITLIYKIKKDGLAFIYGANFYNIEDVNIFNSHDVTSNDRSLKKGVGNYEAIMWIPENLLNEGILSISIAFFRHSPYELFLYLNKVITINIVDYMKGDSSRGNYLGDFPGFIRPLLNWETKKF
jgi:lipopolysaccharide transport system ATP-binding protein